MGREEKKITKIPDENFFDFPTKLQFVVVHNSSLLPTTNTGPI